MQQVVTCWLDESQKCHSCSGAFSIEVHGVRGWEKRADLPELQCTGVHMWNMYFNL